jgi:hypothetical protein
MPDRALLWNQGLLPGQVPDGDAIAYNCSQSVANDAAWHDVTWTAATVGPPGDWGWGTALIVVPTRAAGVYAGWVGVNVQAAVGLSGWGFRWIVGTTVYDLPAPTTTGTSGYAALSLPTLRFAGGNLRLQAYNASAASRTVIFNIELFKLLR